MKMDIDEIVEKIELLRQELHEIGKKKSLLNEKVIKKSQELDNLLNFYHKLVNAKKT